MRSTDFCFPLLSTTSTRAAFAPSISSKLAPRPFAPGLAPWMMGTGGPDGSRRPIRFGGRLRVSCVAFSSAHFRRHRASDIPVAYPGPSLRLREARFHRIRRDRDVQAVHEEPPATRSRMPSIASLPRHARVAPTLESGHVKVSAAMRVPVSLRPPLRTLVRWSCELGARP